MNSRLIIVVTTGKAKVLTNKKATMLYCMNFAKCHASQNIGKYLKKIGLTISD
jgi:hypothetical protein